MIGANRQLSGHVSHDEGLADCLTAGDRQRLISISRVGKAIRHKVLAWNFIQRPQHIGVDDPALAQIKQELHATDAVVGGWWSGHGR